MRLSKRINWILILVMVMALGVVFGGLLKMYSNRTYAEGESGAYEVTGAKYVTFYDGGEKLIVKTDAQTVGEALERAEIVINSGDIVEPGLETEINADNFFVNIYRARPVMVKDGVKEKYLMTASYDAKVIMKEAGLTVYDGDEIKMVANTDFLEAGMTTVYEITRNGGRTLTVDEEIAFEEERVKDYDMEPGKEEVKQLGEVGTKRLTYNVLYVDNEEVSRELVAEEVVREPVKRIVAEGAKAPAPSVPPGSETCAQWVREAGVAEADVPAALELIYHESGCRVNARNASSGAYGIPQALPGSKMASAGADWETNPVTQIKWMAGYVSRYGGWQGALRFWNAHRWY